MNPNRMTCFHFWECLKGRGLWDSPVFMGTTFIYKITSDGCDSKTIKNIKDIQYSLEYLHTVLHLHISVSYIFLCLFAITWFWHYLNNISLVSKRLNSFSFFHRKGLGCTRIYEKLWLCASDQLSWALPQDWNSKTDDTLSCTWNRLIAAPSFLISRPRAFKIHHP